MMMNITRNNNEITCSNPETYSDNVQSGKMLTSLLEEVVTATGVSYAEIFSTERKRKNSMARHLFCFIARRHLRCFTLTEIAAVFNISHCTVIFAIRNIENMLQLPDYVSQMVQVQYLEILGFRIDDLKINKT